MVAVIVSCILNFFWFLRHVILSLFIAKKCFMLAIHKGYTSCIVSNQAQSVLVESCIHIVYMFQIHVTCLRLHIFSRQIFIYGAIFISHAQPLPHHSHPTCSVKHMYPKLFVHLKNCIFQGRVRQEPQHEDLYTLYLYEGTCILGV